MSNPLRIALVAEGTTEFEVIQAALQAILSPRSFVLTKLQPEETKPEMGTGWGGVLKWCNQLAGRHTGYVESDPTLALFDGVILHLDADVATFSYGNLRPPYTNAEAAAQGWQPLPCAHTCPPTDLPADSLQAVLLSWLHPTAPGTKTVLCIPAMNTGAWQAVAKLPPGHALLQNLECNINIEAQLKLLPIDLRVDKKKRESRLDAAVAVTTRWPDVTALCSRAQAFEQGIQNAFL